MVLKFKAEAGALVKVGEPTESALRRLTGSLGLPQGCALEESGLARWLRNKGMGAHQGGGGTGPPAVDLKRFLYLRLPPGLSVPDCLGCLQGHPLIDFVEADPLAWAGEVIPSDPQFNFQWHLANADKPGADIQATKAWDITTGSADVIVAVLDTGLDPTVTEFLGRVVPGYDFVNDDSDPYDDFGHGTSVASVIAANANNGFGGAGVDWHCRIMPVRVLSTINQGLLSWAAQGVDFAVLNGCKIINYSAGSNESSIAMTRAIEDAINSGVVFVTITHNEAPGVILYPGSLPEVLTVGSTAPSDRLSAFSGYGDGVDLVAPGELIYTTARLGAPIIWLQGSSYAGAQVAGVCALMASLRPGLTQEEADLWLKLGAEDQVGDDEDLPGYDPLYGWGRLNAFRSLQFLTNGVAGLTLGHSAHADPASVGCELIYSITLTNWSMKTATGIVLTNVLDPTSTLVRTAASQGSTVPSGEKVIFQLGTLIPRQVATMSVVVRPTVPGILSNRVHVVSDTFGDVPGLGSSVLFTLSMEDHSGPVPVTAQAQPDGITVRALFSEILDPSDAAVSARYSLRDSQGQPVALEAVALQPDGRTVQLTASLWGHDGPFELTVNGLLDCVGNRMESAKTVPVELPPFQLIAAGSLWSYWDQGEDPGTAWRLADWQDPGWIKGRAELGYGDNVEATVVGFGPNPNAKYITTYFRHAFDVPDPAHLASVTIRLLRDDGAVVYLNGTEIFRSNMPEGSVDFFTEASSSVTDEEERTFFATDVDPSGLVPGVNVLAVEVHQSSGSSSDLSFDLEMEARLAVENKPPVFVRNLVPQTVVEGGAVWFEVELQGTLPFGYRWRRGNSTIVPFGQGGPQFVLTNARPADAGFYSVVVTNPATAIGVISSRVNLTVLLDGDGDGLPDVWESWYGLEPSDPSDAALDLDMDGFTNGQEYWGGTDPSDPLSYLKIERVRWDEGVLSLDFNAASNSTYVVSYRDDPATGDWRILANVAARPTNRVERIEDATAGSFQRFYRLSAPRLP